MQDDITNKSTNNNGPLTPPTKHFETPEEIASHDNQPSDQPNLGTEESSQLKPKPNHKKFWPPTKKRLLVLSGGLIIVLLIVGSGLYLATSHKHTTTVTFVPKPVIKKPVVIAPDTVPSTLTGLQVAPNVNQRPITAIMIENTPYARPQAGLSQAGVIIEALTEGGITRFMALYQNELPSYVGPIRSVRPYFLDWDLGFDAPIAHVGGSPQALSEINTLGVKNLDYLLYPSYYERISSRPPPHNVYTSLANLMKLEANLGWTSSNFSGWPRQAANPVSHPNATTINFYLSYSTYNVSYSYDQSSNSYNRSEGGAPQIGANTGKQLSPKVVIAMIVPWSQGSLDTSDAYYSVYQDIGSGQAYVFQNGSVTIGQWSKPSVDAPLSFTTSSGQVLKLNAGQTWITVLGSNNDISYN